MWNQPKPGADMAEILFIAPLPELAELAKDWSAQGMSARGQVDMHDVVISSG